MKDRKRDSQRREKTLASSVLIRTEKVCSAIYMVTDHISESESLRMNLRDKADKVAVSVSDAIAKRSGSRVFETVGYLTALVMLLGIAARSGMISRPNSSMLREELISLQNDLERSVKGDDRRGDVMNSLAKRDGEGAPYERVLRSRNESYDFSEDEIISLPERSDNKGQSFIKDIVKDKGQEMSYINKEELSKPSVQSTPGDSQTRNNSSFGAPLINGRRKTIISYLEQNGLSSIKDIAAVVTGCSEKTIQRELGYLVDQGVLVREGERRWSRYDLAPKV